MIRFPNAFVLLACIAGFSGLRAEEAGLSAEDEAKIAAKEDALGDEEMLLKKKSVFTGTVDLDDPDKTSDRGVIGRFIDDDGKAYPMKSASDEVLAQLRKVDKKKATVAGKLRVNDKYLVVLAVVESTPSSTPRDKRKRNGL